MGAIGNVLDRLLYRSVPDFIDFHIGNFHWFIFNVADIFITMGVIFLILIEFTDNTEEKNYDLFKNINFVDFIIIILLMEL